MRCCVPGCEVKFLKGAKRHNLPKDPQRRRIWCEIINRPDLIQIDEKARKNTFRICDSHFSDKDKLDCPNLRTNLQFNAIPSIIPGSSRPVLPLAMLPSSEENPCNVQAIPTYGQIHFSEKCRTCLSEEDRQNFTNITKPCHLGKSYKSAILMLVPNMDETLLASESCICKNCAETLTRSMELIQKCLTIEKRLKKYILQLQNNKQKENVMANGKSAEQCSISIEISEDDATPVLVDSTTDEHSDSDVSANDNDQVADADHDYYSVSSASANLIFCALDGVDHDRVVSLNSSDPDTMEKQLSCLTENGINVSDITTNQNVEKKRIIFIGSDVPTKCPDCFKCLKYHKSHICPKNDNGATRPKVIKLLEKCLLCDKELNPCFMNLHLRKHERDERRKIEYERRKQVKEREQFTCQTCNERFISKEELECHLELHPPYVCEMCGKGFTKKTSLKAHLVTHNEPNSFICEVCGKGYKDQKCLRTHLQLHQSGIFKCTLCPKVFKQKIGVSRHMRQVHNKIFKFQCTECGKLFLSRGTLDGHIKLVHWKEKPYECQICQTRFGRADYLQSHMSRHSTDRTEKTLKGEVFQHSRQRRQRTKLRYIINDNGQPARCKFCGVWQRDMMALKRHLETHFKRYPCQFCPLTFARKPLCKRHEQVLHQGTATNCFRCNVCWKKLRTKEELDEHIQYHDKPRHRCDICGRAFNRRFLMNHHKLMDHCETPDPDKAEEIIYESLVEVSKGDNVIQLIV